MHFCIVFSVTRRSKSDPVPYDEDDEDNEGNEDDEDNELFQAEKQKPQTFFTFLKNVCQGSSVQRLHKSLTNSGSTTPGTPIRCLWF